MKTPWNWKRYFLFFLGFTVLIFSCYCVFAALYSYKQSRIKPQGHSPHVMMVRPLSLDLSLAPYSEYEPDTYPSYDEWAFPESSEQEEEPNEEEQDDDAPPTLDPNWDLEPEPSEELPSEPEPGDGEGELPPDGEGEDPPPEDTPPEPEEPLEDEPEISDTELLLGIKDSVDSLLICFMLCMSCGVVFLVCRAVWPLFRGW